MYRFGQRIFQSHSAKYWNTFSKSMKSGQGLKVFSIGVAGVFTIGNGYQYFFSTSYAKENPTGHSRFTLYQYSNCPFCSKVRAYLHNCGEEFTIVEVNPITKAEVKSVTDYRKVPVLIADNVILKESGVINSVLETHFTTGKPIAECVKLYPAVVTNGSTKVPSVSFDQEKQNMRTVLLALYNNISAAYNDYVKRKKEVIEYPNKYVVMGYDEKKNREMEQLVKWRKWIDNHFVHLISPNVYRTWREALQAFDYFTTNGNFTEFQKVYIRYIGAGVMFMIGKKLRDRHGLNADVRSDLYSGLNQWLRAIKGKKFMGGDTPNLADIEMWGMCSAFHGLECWEDACKITKIEKWYNRMERYMQKRSKNVVASANPTVTEFQLPAS